MGRVDRSPLNQAERDRCDAGAPEGRAGRVAGASQFFEGLFDFGELQVEGPEFRRGGVGEVGAQKVAAFASPGLAQFGAVEPPGERGGLALAAAAMGDFD